MRVRWCEVFVIFVAPNRKFMYCKQFLTTILFALMLCLCSQEVMGKGGNLVDSVMERVNFFAPMHCEAVKSYDAGLYIKGWVNIRKKNHLMRFIPTMFRLRKGVRQYLVESYSDLKFTAPNLYDQKLKASVGTVSEFWEMDDRLPEYFHINVYAPTLLYDQFISPLAANARKYYTYRMDSVTHVGRETRYYISFTPRSRSYQLVVGHLVVSNDVWSVRELHFQGRSRLMRFDNHVRMGEVGKIDEFVPVHCRMMATFSFLGNVVDADYTAQLDYRDIALNASATSSTRKDKYDLTDYYVLRCDTNAYHKDTTFFQSIRPTPLTSHEKQLYVDYFLRNDTLRKRPRWRNKRLQFWGELGDALISRYTLDLADMGSVRCSPLINPFLVSYSGSNGFSYRQEFKYSLLASGDRLLRVNPRIGYNFTRKEFYWSLPIHFDYWPAKRAAIRMDIGNGNRIYSSDVLDDLKSIPDSIFNFDALHLDYFKDLYFKFTHTWEIVNGLTLDVGLTIHRRTEINRSDFQAIRPTVPPQSAHLPTDVGNGQEPALTSQNQPGFDTEILSRLSHVYTSFAPRLRLSWTPGQYYYMKGARKINLHSRFPTFSVDWERGIGGVLRNSGTYERVEVDMHHQIKLAPMRNMYVRMGWGMFTNQDNMYFVDFANFTRNNLPVGWHEEVGGVFQLLDRRWYNSSTQYLRAHATYEAPFLLMRHLMKYTQYVLNERLYVNALVVPHLKPYLEVGYGIGTHVFDFGLFASFGNWKYQEIGCKFTFELFNW